MTAVVKVQGQTVKVYADVVLMLKGRAEGSVEFTNVGAPFDPTLETTLIATFGNRMVANA
ncbi:MAG: hypothetical protein LC663_00880 [Actinobacteria bacterium]|nr:hypothetical protein [Actinomycetota bacterium]